MIVFYLILFKSTNIKWPLRAMQAHTLALEIQSPVKLSLQRPNNLTP